MPLPIPLHYREDCGLCYGNGCSSCAYRGWFESAEGRKAREAEEDRRYDEWRDRQHEEKEFYDGDD